MSDIIAYKKTALTGGSASALDGISGAVLLGGEFAQVMVGGVVYIYELNATSGAAESSPDIIAPDVSPGNKRWILQNYYLKNAYLRGSATDTIPAVGADLTTIYPADLQGVAGTKRPHVVTEDGITSNIVLGADIIIHEVEDLCSVD